MDGFMLRDDLIVECENCKTEIIAKISVLENNNSLDCPECGAERIVNLEELRRQLDLMRETFLNMQNAGAAAGDEKAD